MSYVHSHAKPCRKMAWELQISSALSSSFTHATWRAAAHKYRELFTIRPSTGAPRNVCRVMIAQHHYLGPALRTSWYI